jgi:hypothetical protein
MLTLKQFVTTPKPRSIVKNSVTAGNRAANWAMSVTCHVVAVFDRDEEGNLKPGEALEVTNAAAAERAARGLAEQHAGAVAFSRTGDPATGEFQDGAILAQFGDVDLDALSA